jgi:hypothetical protein
LTSTNQATDGSEVSDVINVFDREDDEDEGHEARGQDDRGPEHEEDD